MSHIVAIQTKVRDPAAVTAACRRLGRPRPSARPSCTAVRSTACTFACPAGLARPSTLTAGKRARSFPGRLARTGIWVSVRSRGGCRAGRSAGR